MQRVGARIPENCSIPARVATCILVDVESGERTHVVTDPYAQHPSTSWSHDSRWIAYDLTEPENQMSSIWVYDVAENVHHRVTSPMFNDHSPTFDSEGDYLYFTSGRTFRPEYSPVDGTFIYTEPGNLFALALRNDMDALWTVEFDEVKWGDEEEEEEDSEEDDGEGEEDEGDEDEDEGHDDDEDEGHDDDDDEGHDDDDASAAPGIFNMSFLLFDDPISGTWNGSVEVIGAPGDVPPISFVLELEMEEDLSVTGTVDIDMVGVQDLHGNWDPDAGELTLNSEEDDEPTVFTVEGNTMVGERSEGGMTMIMTATRADQEESSGGSTKDDKSEKKDKDEPVEIDFENIESRAVLLPTGVGSYGNLAVNSSNELLYLKDGETPYLRHHGQ